MVEVVYISYFSFENAYLLLRSHKILSIVNEKTESYLISVDSKIEGFRKR